MSKTMTLRPRLSEKTYVLSQVQNTFVFDVPLSANKHQVFAAIAAQFTVTPLDVRMVVSKGKVARSIRIGGSRKNVLGKRPDYKKAYIRLKAGDHIPVFAAIEKAEEDEKKAEEKVAKKAAKSTKTVNKAKPAVKTTNKKVTDKPEKVDEPKPEPQQEKKDLISSIRSRLRLGRKK